jgi:hypothetical protein
VPLELCLAIRRLARTPLIGLLLVASIGVGLGFTSAAFEQLETALLSELPYPEPNRLFRIWFGERPGEAAAVLPSEYDDLSTAVRGVFGELAAYRTAVVPVGVPGAVDHVPAAFISVSFTEVLGVAPLCTSASALEHAVSAGEPIVSLRRGYADQHLPKFTCGSDHSLDIDGRSHRVAGLLPDWLTLPTSDTSVFIPFEPKATFRRHGDNVRLTNVPVSVMGRLAVALSPVEAAQVVSMRGSHRGVRLLGLREESSRRFRDTVLLIQSLAVAVLLVTLVGVGQVILARASGADNDTRLYLALGATVWRSHLPVLYECLFFGVSGAVLSVLVHRASEAVLAASGERIVLIGWIPAPSYPSIVVRSTLVLVSGSVAGRCRTGARARPCPDGQAHSSQHLRQAGRFRIFASGLAGHAGGAHNWRCRGGPAARAVSHENAGGGLGVQQS